MVAQGHAPGRWARDPEDIGDSPASYVLMQHLLVALLAQPPGQHVAGPRSPSSPPACSLFSTATPLLEPSADPCHPEYKIRPP